jgi:deoxyhypusine synthase
MYLSKPRIYPQRIEAPLVEKLVEYYYNSRAYNGGRLAEACKIYEKMITDDATICVTVAGALIPAGLGGALISLLENGLVDYVISTGGNLYHDMHFALDLPVHQGDYRVSDTELLKKMIVRIYDIFIPYDTLFETDLFIQHALDDIDEKIISTSYLHNYLGHALLKSAPQPNLSLLAMAAKYDVPVYTSSPGDSSIGMNLSYLKLIEKGVIIDSDLDVIETASIVLSSHKNGAIQLGGGSPKNFFMQTQPMLSQILGINEGGHDYFIQITSDSPHWGGLSGATPSEAVSWGKINPEEIGNDVVVYADCTLAAPILFSYILQKKKKRTCKRLYRKREALVGNLKKRIT